MTEKIKTIALQLIEEDRVSQRWQTERIRYERSKVLDKLKVQLEETMPEYKKFLFINHMYWDGKREMYIFSN